MGFNVFMTYESKKKKKKKKKSKVGYPRQHGNL